MKVKTIKTQADSTIDQLSDQQLNIIKGGDNDIFVNNSGTIGDLDFGG